MKHVFEKKIGPLWDFLGILLVAFLFACAQSDDPDTGAIKVRIPVNDELGQYHLQTVELTSVRDLSAMSDDAVNVHVGGRFDTEIDSGTAKLKFADIGTTPSAHFLKVDGVYIPADYNSLIMTAAVYQFERLRAFFDKYGANEGLFFPRSLLINVKESTTDGNQVFSTLDNAQYVFPFDVFVINPYHGNLIPSSINAGLLGHEWWHSIFLHSVGSTIVSKYKEGEISKGDFKDINTMTSLFKPDTQGITDSDELDTIPVGPLKEKFVIPKEIMTCSNDYNLSSFNEGLADFMGYAFTHDPRFGMASYPASVNQVRNLDFEKGSPFSLYGSEEDYIAWSLTKGHRDPCRVDPHGLGASIARYLYVVSLDWGLDETVKRVLAFTKKYSNVFVSNRARKFLGVGQVLPLFFEDRQPSSDLCRKLTAIFPQAEVPLKACENIGERK